MIDIKKFIKGLTVKQEVDTTKQLTLTVDAAATTNTTTTLSSKQTANRHILLPDADGTLMSSSSALDPNQVVVTNGSSQISTGSNISVAELQNLDNSTENIQSAITGIRSVNTTQNGRLDGIDSQISTINSTLPDKVENASNLGAGSGLFSSKSGLNLQFKSLVAGTNVSLSSDANTVTINSTAGGGGANTTLSNLTSPVAANQNIVPDVTNTRSLGSSTIAWDTLYARALRNQSNAPIMDISGANPSFNSLRLTDVSDPVNPQDAATKAYVDAGSGGGGANTSLSNLTNPTSVNQSISPDGTFNVRNLGTNTNAWNRVWSYNGYSLYDGSAGFDALTSNQLKLGSNTDAIKLQYQDNNLASGWSSMVKPSTGSSGYGFLLGTSNYVGSSGLSSYGANLVLQSGNTSNILNASGSNVSAFSGNTDIRTGDVSSINMGSGALTTATGVSGDALILTGDSSSSGAAGASSYSGLITLKTGSASTARGYIKLDALAVEFPTGASDPSITNLIKGDLVGGATYFNTTSNTLRMYNGTAWGDVSGGSSGANTTLSNLTSPTSINQDLLPNGVKNLGSSSLPWSSAYISGTISLGLNTSFADNAIRFANVGSVLSVDPLHNDTSLVTANSSSSSAVTGSITLRTGNESSASNSSSGSIILRSGDTANASPFLDRSGNIELTVGTGSTRGKIVLDGEFIDISRKSTDPTTDSFRPLVSGSTYYNTTSNKLRVYDGSAWSDVGGGAPAFVGASYTRNSIQSIPTTTYTTILYNISEYDTNSAYNSSTGEYTVPSTGIYEVNAAAQMSHPLTDGSIRIAVNGTSKAAQIAIAKQNNLSITRTLSLTAGDIIVVQVYHTEASASSVGSGELTWLNIQKIG